MVEGSRNAISQGRGSSPALVWAAELRFSAITKTSDVETTEFLVSCRSNINAAMT